jgi:hypothetical protein
MANPFSVNCWAAIWVDMIHECMGAYGMGKGMFAPQNSLITIHEQDDMHFFFIISYAPSFVVAFSVSTICIIFQMTVM